MPRNVQKIIEDDANKADLGVDETVDAGTPPPPEKTGPTPEEVASDLRKQLEDATKTLSEERTLREQAEARVGKERNNAHSAQVAQIASVETAVANKISAAKTNLASIKQQMKLAKANGDSDAEVDLAEELANARFVLNNAEWEKNNFENWKIAREQQPKEAPVQENKSPYTRAEQDWIARHPEFNKNKRFSTLSKTAAQEARDAGHAQDSKAYFNAIESTLKEFGFLGGETDPTSGADDPPPSTFTATPPNRSGNGATPPQRGPDPKYPFLPKNFTIPKEWVQAAADQEFDDPREYANLRLEQEANERGRQ